MRAVSRDAHEQNPIPSFRLERRKARNGEIFPRSAIDPCSALERYLRFAARWAATVDMTAIGL